jgi:hypothetical protein
LLCGSKTSVTRLFPQAGRQSNRGLVSIAGSRQEKQMEMAIWIWILVAPAVAFVAMSKMKG